MAATTSGALKAYIEGLGLSISVYRDQAPPGVAPPYVTVMESVAFTPDPFESSDPDTPNYQTVKEMVQVDLWENWRNTGTSSSPTDTDRESTTLAGSLVAALQGARLIPVGSHAVYGVFVRNKVRLIEQDNNLVHHAITCDVYRQM